MDIRNYEFQSDFARKYVAQGRAGGKAEGKAEAILAVLDERCILVSSENRERILGTTDLELLNDWIRRAISVPSADELFR